jgi:hypothetical protein
MIGEDIPFLQLDKSSDNQVRLDISEVPKGLYYLSFWIDGKRVGGQSFIKLKGR